MKVPAALLAVLAGLASPHALADPPPQDGQWRGKLGAALSVSAGNTRADSLTLTGDATRATPTERVTWYGQLIYGRSIRDDISQTTANLWRTGARHDWNFTPFAFTFISLDLEHDQLKLLNLRSVPAGGVGRHLILSPDLTWDVFLGLTRRFDRYSEPGVTVEGTVRGRYSIAEMILGEESNHKLSNTTSFRQRIAVFPNLAEGGEFRVTADATLAVAMDGATSLTVTLQDRYDSLARYPVKPNDFIFFTGVNVRLGPK